MDGIDREGDRDRTPQFDRSAFALQKGPVGAEGLEQGDDSDMEDGDKLSDEGSDKESDDV